MAAVAILANQHPGEEICIRPPVARLGRSPNSATDARSTVMPSSATLSRHWRTSPPRERSFGEARRSRRATTPSSSWRTRVVAIRCSPYVLRQNAGMLARSGLASLRGIVRVQPARRICAGAAPPRPKRLLRSRRARTGPPGLPAFRPPDRRKLRTGGPRAMWGRHAGAHRPQQVAGGGAACFPAARALYREHRPLRESRKGKGVRDP